MVPSLMLSLLLTLLIELPVARLYGVRKRDLQLVLLVNLLTNPPVVLCSLLLPACWWAMELAAVAVEALCYAKRGDHIAQPIRLSIAANVTSFALGALMQFLF